ncbi:MAG: phosphotransferase [Methylococcales bacterium]|nr:phosphotransferase [Methylococcales bacterium]
MLNTDTRAKSIIHWLSHTLKLEIKQFEAASSDASFRRYFRVIHSKGQHIVMDAPPEKEDTEPFIRTAQLFKKYGVNVPEIYQQELEQGFLLLEDFGSECFLDKLTTNNASNLYVNAINRLCELQTAIPLTDCQLPHYDETLLTNEIMIFYQWFVEKFLQQNMPNTIKESLNQQLISSALEQPKVCVHRDFHSRNLMVTADESLGIIDFQDAVIGAITYDLVSLLRDCYVDWPEHQINQWKKLYFDKMIEHKLINVDIETFDCWFDLMGLQRHLKAIGIFARLHLRDNKSNYLDDIPRTLNYVTQICAKYPELNEFNDFLTHTLLPAYKKTYKNKR